MKLKSKEVTWFLPCLLFAPFGDGNCNSKQQRSVSSQLRWRRCAALAGSTGSVWPVAEVVYVQRGARCVANYKTY